MLLSDPVIKRKAGRPAKDQPPRIPSYAELKLDLVDRDKQAESVRQQAYTISKLLGRNILTALRDNDKQGMKESVISFGICADKVLSGVESSGIDLHIPAALIDKFALALNVKPVSTPPIDITPNG